MSVPASTTYDNLNILLLEDYALDAELVRTQISRTHPGWQVDHVKNRDGFLSYLKDHNPDIVLSDYSMPSFTGMEAFLKVKELGLEIPFIIVTGDLPEETAIECIKEGIDDYIIKSSLIRLDVAIQKAIQRKQSEHERNLISEQLRLSERRYKSIFDHAGVALVEFSAGIDILQVVNSRDKKSLVKDFMKSLVVMEVNEEALTVFEAASKAQFMTEFHQLFYKDLYSYIHDSISVFADGASSVENRAHIRTLKGHKKVFQVKTVLDAKRPHFFTVSFIDITNEVQAESRSLKIMERLEDTVAQRMLELSELNEKLRIEGEERDRINDVMRENYIAMTESIIAAKRIQQLLLPSQSDIAAGFSDAFVYMRPKDIVSGDFYWYYKQGDIRWVACVDCTGHGVPGAFMSMISSKMLNQSIIENGISDPSKVLEAIDRYVVTELKQHQSGTLTSTGMDISLCKFDYGKMELEFAGAYQSLFRMKDGELDCFKGDRHSLGGTFKHTSKSYSLHKMPFEKDEYFYMLSDGFVDQFGGPKNKKFTRRRLISLLKKQDSENMYDQEMSIKSAFQDWKGTYEQIDDILVMGIRT